MIAKTSQCRLTALAAAVLLALSSAPAAALSLGRVTVQSALGEPLRAEVDFLDINGEEAASLNAHLAAPEAFKAAGLEYNPALSNLKTTLQRRADGRAYLKLSSDGVVNEPFVDLILEASWNSGRIVRDYTLLFDPPNLRSAGSAVPDKTQLPIQSAPAAAQPAARSAEAVPAKPATVKPAVLAKPNSAAQQQAAGAVTVQVKPGETAGQIAAAHKPASVSLDQMLVAMLRGNPKAFIQDNVNRIKAGAILTVPTPDQAAAVDADEATQTVVAQSRDFNEFRRRLAGNVPQTQAAPTGREASGKVQGMVQDKTPVAAAPDKLTLSKGAIQGKSGDDQLAAARNSEEAKVRAAEVAKNINDLNKLAAAASTPAPAPVTAAAPAPIPGASAETALPTLPTLPQAAPASEAAPATAAVSKPAPPASKPAAKLPEPAPEPSFIDTLVENPMLPGGVVALLGLLAGLAYLKNRQRKQDALLDSTFAESSLAEAFSGASGGQSVDTSDSLTTGSSMVYSPSQIDAADDVDPVAEAEVYLAYGRDLQAEEILKDALRNTPQRVAIHAKLAEIYAKRRDAKALEAVAALAFNLTNGSGPDWEHICAKGLSIDPDNALYLPGGQPGASVASGASADSTHAENAGDATAAPSARTGPRTTLSDGSELDLDLDFSLEEPEFLKTPAGEPTIGAALDDAPASPTNTASAASEAKAEPSEPTTIPGGLDFTEPQALEESQPAQLAPELEDNQASFIADLSASVPESSTDAQPNPEPGPVFEAPLLPEMPSAEGAPAPSEAPAELSLASDGEPMAPAAGKDMLSFDLDSLSLDLAEDRLTMPGDLPEPAMDALETKLALAEEFRAIGDDDGARALIEEVIAEASGEVKAKAQQALNKL